MRRDDTEGSGFAGGKPWLPLSRDRTRNIKGQQSDRNSLLNLYRELIALRREEPCLSQGEYLPRRAKNDVFSFGRRMNDTEILVGEPRLWEREGCGVRLLSTGLDCKQEKVAGDRST
ncbi:alpha-amylase family glycosyl hydrolase [Bradyrhizobium sp. USDA 3256]